MDCRRWAVDDDRSRRKWAVDEDRRRIRWAVDEDRHRRRWTVNEDRRRRRWVVDNDRRHEPLWVAQVMQSLDRMDDLCVKFMHSVERIMSRSSTIPTSLLLCSSNTHEQPTQLQCNPSVADFDFMEGKQFTMSLSDPPSEPTPPPSLQIPVQSCDSLPNQTTTAATLHDHCPLPLSSGDPKSSHASVRNPPPIPQSTLDSSPALLATDSQHQPDFMFAIVPSMRRTQPLHHNLIRRDHEVRLCISPLHKRAIHDINMDFGVGCIEEEVLAENKDASKGKAMEELLPVENDFTEPLPSGLGHCRNLNSLWIRNNRISGYVTAEMWKQPHIWILELNNGYVPSIGANYLSKLPTNQFTVNIPRVIGLLYKLSENTDVVLLKFLRALHGLQHCAASSARTGVELFIIAGWASVYKDPAEKARGFSIFKVNSNAECNKVESVVDLRYSNMKNVSEAVDWRKDYYSKLFTEQQMQQSPAAGNEIFVEKPKKNGTSFTSMIYGYAHNFQPHETFKLFVEIYDGKIKPDQVVMVGLMSACAQINMNVNCGNMEGAAILFDLMQIRDMVSYCSWMPGYFGANAAKLFDKMHKKSIIPYDASVTVMLMQCNTELAEILSLSEVDSQNTVNFVLMSNVYAEDNKWDDVSPKWKIIIDSNLVDSMAVDHHHREKLFDPGGLVTPRIQRDRSMALNHVFIHYLSDYIDGFDGVDATEKDQFDDKDKSMMPGTRKLSQRLVFSGAFTSTQVKDVIEIEKNQNNSFDRDRTSTIFEETEIVSVEELMNVLTVIFDPGGLLKITILMKSLDKVEPF